MVGSGTVLGMAFIHLTDTHETTVLREVFGPDVANVCFWDAEEGGGKFNQVVGYAADGRELATITPDQPHALARLTELASDRGETVKF